jgi:hypothetical protein
MSKPALHVFANDTKGPAPHVVRANKLDANFKRLTILPGRTKANGRPEYQVEFKDYGVQLSNLSGVPDGATARAFDICENGEPKTYWMLTWDSPPAL